MLPHVKHMKLAPGEGARTGRPEVESSQLVVAPNGELRTRAAPGKDGDARPAGGVVKVSGTPTYAIEVGLAEKPTRSS